ncbi:hypothetical protein [Luteibacter yeojuensis]|uniref:DMSO reductase anchor subunit n=1 Tax=Luteibacter yeojuensis TaxID=345309 RepID=A0A7X5QWK1_9GAMM|nr:hypothetical protein [Luteibacter yeojuensis]NID16620.1 hypothetical protein [Luteibacter yeojuensis]
MAEPTETPSVALDPQGRPDRGDPARNLFSTPSVVIQTATATGYGLWMVLGTALALGTYPNGRGEVLVPLSIGLVFVASGLVATCLRLPFASDWHGWNPVKRMMPTLEGMIAMVNFLPMLALAGLARGDNDFWATRLAGAALMLCSLATLVYTARGISRGLPIAVAAVANTLPLARTTWALFAGGLWFWLCVALQTETPTGSFNPWRLALLAVALALGIVEGMRWRALRRLAEENGAAERFSRGRGAISLLGGRVAVAMLSVGLPSLLLISHPAGPTHALAAGLAALSCVIGQCLEQRLYGRAYDRLVAGRA